MVNGNEDRFAALIKKHGVRVGQIYKRRNTEFEVVWVTLAFCVLQSTEESTPMPGFSPEIVGVTGRYSQPFIETIDFIQGKSVHNKNFESYVLVKDVPEETTPRFNFLNDLSTSGL